MMTPRFQFLLSCATGSLALSAASVAAAQTATPAAPSSQAVPSAPPTAQAAPPSQGPTDRVPRPTAAPAEADDGGYAARGEGGEIVVTGLRSSLRSAQALKRNSDSIVDAIVAEDIGKLPDNNASEALARITGVQVNRSNDEANGVLVRGLPDLTTTFNGREIFTAEGRGVALQDFPAGALAALEVYKSGTADLIEPGLAGLINVRARRPFDFDGLEIAGGVRGSYNDQSGKFDPIGNLLISDRWETGIGEIGALVNFSYTQNQYRNAVRFAQAFTRTPAGATEDPTDATAVPDDLVVATPGVGNQFVFPGSVGNFYATGKRWRPSINGSLQWKPTPDLEIYADGLWQAYRGRQSNEHFEVSLERASLVPTGQVGVRPTLSNVVLVDGEPDKAASLTKTGGYPAEMYRSTFDDNTDTYQGAIGFVWKTGRARISSDLAYTRSTYTSSEYSLDSMFTSAPTVNVAFDVDGAPDFDLGGYDALDPANYNFRGYYEARRRTTGDSIQWRGDVSLDTDWSWLPTLQFGGRYVDRTATVEAGNRYADANTLGIALTSLPTGSLEEVRDGFRNDDLPRFQNWLMPSRSAIRGNFTGLQDIARQALAQRVAADPTNTGFADQLARFAEADIPIDPTASYSASEQTYAAYAQGKYAFAVADIDIDGTFGVRAVNTAGVYRGTARVQAGASGPITFTPSEARQNYIDILPSANMRIKFTPKFQARFAFTMTRTRPSFDQLNPAVNIQANPPGQGGGSGLFDATGSSGNPDLVPLTSKNYDATLEWYFSRTGSLTGAIFYRDLKGFIGTYQRELIDPTYGRVLFSRPENAGAGRVKGAEVAVQTFFDFLPGILSGFGGQANVTYLDGNNQLPAVFGEDAPIVPLTGVSRWTYNLTGFYEKGPISTRLSYNRRTQFVNSFNRLPGEPQFAGETTRAVARLDYSLAYTPYRNLTLTLDVGNILAQPFNNFRNYNATQFFPRDVREEGRFYSIGARFRF